MKKGWDTAIERSMPPDARVPAELHIGNVRIAPATVLAPMAGVTDTVFRRFIKNASLYTAPPPCAPHLDSEMWASTEPTDPTEANVDLITSNEVSGCGLIMTEFTSADGLSRMRETKRKRYLTYY
jgi:tRNA-dihydrouridine synthase B